MSVALQYSLLEGFITISLCADVHLHAEINTYVCMYICMRNKMDIGT